MMLNKQKAVRIIALVLFILLSIALILMRAFGVYTVLTVFRILDPINNQSVAELEYRTDIEPLTNRFPILEGSTVCFWKASTINDSRAPGPTDIYIRGFVVLTESTFNQLKEEYTWENIMPYPPYQPFAPPRFEEGMEPEVTGHTTFDWYQSKEFTDYMILGRYAGEMHVDLINGILYIDITTY